MASCGFRCCLAIRPSDILTRGCSHATFRTSRATRRFMSDGDNAALHDVALLYARRQSLRWRRISSARITRLGAVTSARRTLPGWRDGARRTFFARSGSIQVTKHAQSASWRSRRRINGEGYYRRAIDRSRRCSVSSRLAMLPVQRKLTDRRPLSRGTAPQQRLRRRVIVA